MIREATTEDVVFLEALLGSDPKPLMERSWTLMNDYGAVFFDPVTPSFSVVEAHFVFHPDGRGKKAIIATKEALDYCWDRSVLVIIGRIPDYDRPAKIMARWCGLKLTGSGWREDGELIDFFEIRNPRCLQ